MRYHGIVGPASIYAFGDYIGSGVVNYTGPAITPAALDVPSTKYTGQTKGISASFVAADVTISGVTVGTVWQGGQYNGVMATSPKEAVGANTYLIGIQYVNGPFMVGAAYYGFDSQGGVALTGVSQRHENAFGAGGQRQITPGLQPIGNTYMARVTRVISTS